MKKILIIPILFIACSNPERDEVERMELELKKANEAKLKYHETFKKETGLNPDSVLIDLRKKSDKKCEY